MNIVVIGGASYDHILHVDTLPKPKPDSFFAIDSYYAVGGSGIGKALNMNRILPITFLTKFGTDEAGTKIKNLLDKEKVHYYVDYDESGSVTHTNLMDKKGDRVSIFTTSGSDELLHVDRHKRVILDADIIVLNISSFCKQYIPLIKESRAEVWTDIHDWDGINPYHLDFIDIADVVFMSSDKAKKTYHGIVKRLLRTKKFVLVTHGKKGSEYFSKKEVCKKGIIPFEQIDTNGAGDAYFSGFLYGYVKGQTVEECMKVGMVVSGLSVESKMLFSERLTMEEINNY